MIKIKKTENIFDVIIKVQKNKSDKKKIIIEFPF